jgi:hypothetical protein
MCDLWNEVGLLHSKTLLKKKLITDEIVTFACLVQTPLQTSLGQMRDLISTHNGPDNLAKYNIEGRVIHPKVLEQLFQPMLIYMFSFCRAGTTVL